MRQFEARGSLPVLLIGNMRSGPSGERLQYARSNWAWGTVASTGKHEPPSAESLADRPQRQARIVNVCKPVQVASVGLAGWGLRWRRPKQDRPIRRSVNISVWHRGPGTPMQQTQLSEF
jgi:hypothetical protein